MMPNRCELNIPAVRQHRDLRDEQQAEYRRDWFDSFGVFRSFPLHTELYRSYPDRTTILLHLGENLDLLFAD